MSQYPDTERLIDGLRQDYIAMYPNSRAAHDRAREVLVDGISHGARLFKPYPFRITAAQGARVTDIDGHEIVDYWQGHYANVLGHNPEVVRKALVHDLEYGFGLQTGLPEERQTEFATALAQAVGAERVRLTTAGALATMYAIMLARSFTGRNVVLKIAGGWHGANPLALKGVSRKEGRFDRTESSGVPESTTEEIAVTRFNDVDALEEVFRTQGDRIACFIFEPCLGGAGFLPASAEFVRRARELTEKHGALLIIDEVITGFRFCAGGVQRFYNVQPDLSTFGKVIGGGMPISAVVGRAEVMDLCSESAPNRVAFNGGTFSAHPLSLLAGKTLIEYLIAHEGEIYPELARKGEALRRGIEKVFADRGVLARCTGHGNDAVPGGSLGTIYFPNSVDLNPTCMEEYNDPAVCNVAMREQALKLGLLLNRVNVAHGLGSVSMAHTEADLQMTFEACDAFALRYLAGK